MSNNNLNCHFHPYRDAIGKCEQCGKLLCVECKNIYRRRHSTGSGDHISYYYNQQELCTPCFYDEKIKRYHPAGYICLILFGFIFLGASIFMFNESIDFMNSWMSATNDPSPSILPFFTSIFIIVAIGLIAFGIISLINAPKKVKELEAKKKVFYEMISSSDKARESSYLKYKYCSLCGSQDDLNAKYCSNCGGELELVK